MGDYDSSAWLNYHVPRWWADPARGSIPCGWAFNPNLDRRAPQALHYARTRATEHDWFIAGDCGAGYLNPGMLAAPRLDPEVPDGWDAWIAHNREYFRRYDLSITGFIIDGHAPGMGTRGLDGYLQFSPDGIVGQKIPQQGLHRDTMPMIRMRLDLYGSPPDAGRQLAGLVGEELPAVHGDSHDSPIAHVAQGDDGPSPAGPQGRAAGVSRPLHVLSLAEAPRATTGGVKTVKTTKGRRRRSRMCSGLYQTGDHGASPCRDDRNPVVTAYSNAHGR